MLLVFLICVAGVHGQYTLHGGNSSTYLDCGPNSAVVSVCKTSSATNFSAAYCESGGIFYQMFIVCKEFAWTGTSVYGSDADIDGKLNVCRNDSVITQVCMNVGSTGCNVSNDYSTTACSTPSSHITVSSSSAYNSSTVANYNGEGTLGNVSFSCVDGETGLCSITQCLDGYIMTMLCAGGSSYTDCTSSNPNIAAVYALPSATEGFYPYGVCSPYTVAATESPTTVPTASPTNHTTAAPTTAPPTHAPTSTPTNGTSNDNSLSDTDIGVITLLCVLCVFVIVVIGYYIVYLPNR